MYSDVNRTTAIQRELDCAETELAGIKQEHLLENLVTTGEPTAEAVEQLARLREFLRDLQRLRCAARSLVDNAQDLERQVCPGGEEIADRRRRGVRR
jgi:hypothetical protein